MDYFTLFIIFMVSIPAMSLISMLWKAIAGTIQENEARREQEARERAKAEERRRAQAAAAAQKEAEKAEKAAQAEEKRRAAAEKRKEQKRKAEEHAAAILAKEQERKRKEAEKIEAARQLAELKERALQAEKELKALQAENPLPERPETISPVSAPAQPAALPFKGNNTFAGQVVAFTGTLDGMTRAEAIKAVEANGGKAYADMTAATTILVVGDNPGRNKLDKADRWIGQIRKITQVDFMTKLHAPLTMTPEQFATAYCP